MTDTLTIRDNRTGREYEVPIADGTIRAADLKQISADGETPSMVMKTKRATTETANPIRVAGSTGQRSSRAGKGTTEARVPSGASSSVGRDGER